jgi:hypothetical protein
MKDARKLKIQNLIMRNNGPTSFPEARVSVVILTPKPVLALFAKRSSINNIRFQDPKRTSTKTI